MLKEGELLSIEDVAAGRLSMPQHMAIHIPTFMSRVLIGLSWLLITRINKRHEAGKEMKCVGHCRELEGDNVDEYD